MFGWFNQHLRRRVRTFIEEVGESDVVHLAEIHADAFARGWSDGELARMIANNAYLCLVARLLGSANKPPVGFLLLRVTQFEAEIVTIATHSTSRRNGVAAEMLSAAIRQLQSDRVNTLFLEVDELNIAAISLYKKFGFKQVGERKGYYSVGEADKGKNSAALVMQLDLG